MSQNILINTDLKRKTLILRTHVEGKGWEKLRLHRSKFLKIFRLKLVLYEATNGSKRNQFQREARARNEANRKGKLAWIPNQPISLFMNKTVVEKFLFWWVFLCGKFYKYGKPSTALNSKIENSSRIRWIKSSTRREEIKKIKEDFQAVISPY